MTAERSYTSLRTWVIVSVLLHAGLLLLPAQFFQAVFPRDKPVLREGRTTDPWPGLEKMVMVVIPPEEEQVSEAENQAATEIEAEDVAPTPALEPAAAGGSPDGADVARADMPAGDIEPEFFPPVPRYIVPPTLEDLGISTIEVTVRILVTAGGLPEQVVIDDALDNPEVRRRVLECARRFRFEAARLGDTPIESWIELPLVLESKD
jgi:outer membrane biosynthesis protein TonB